MEVHQTTYAFSTPNKVIDRTLFVNYKVRNCSNNNYPSFRISLWNDPDLGCSSDDFIGNDSTLNTMFVYNADSNDEQSCANASSAGFGAHVGCQAMTFLNKNMENASYYQLGGDTQSGDPVHEIQYFNYANGLWRNGSPYYPCGYANQACANGAGATHFVFPSNPRNANGWSMLTAPISQNDYRTVNTTENIPLLMGGTTSLTVAYSYHTTTDADYLASVDSMYAQVAYLRNLYGHNFTPIPQSNYCVGNDCVFPGDANRDGVVNFFDYLAIGCAFNNTTPLRTNRSNTFSPVSATNGATNLAMGVNVKHQDCDGTGAVGNKDFGVVTQNLGLHNQFYTPPTTVNGTDVLDIKFANNQQVLDTISPVYPMGNSSLGGIFNIILKGVNQQVADFYGVSFDMEVSDSLLRIVMANGSTIQPLQYNDYKMILQEERSTVSPNAFHYKKVRVAFVKTNHQNYTGGVLPLMAFRLVRVTPFPAAGRQTSIKFSNVRFIRNDGSVIANYGASDKLITFASQVYHVATETAEPTALSADIFPNPTSDFYTIDLHDLAAAQASITDLSGKVISNYTLTQSLTQISTANLANGVYFVRLEAKGRIKTYKLMVLK